MDLLPIGILMHLSYDKILKKHKIFIGKTSSFIKDSTEFIHKTHNLHLDEQDLMVSFDVVSLFTKIPILEDLSLISKLVDPKTLDLIKICFSSTFFTFKGVCYEQTEGTTMGWSLSPVVANIFMEHFESLALSSFHLKPKCWFHFVDDMFVIWSHGQANLTSFFNNLTNFPPTCNLWPWKLKRTTLSLS